MTMGMNKQHRPFAERSYEPVSLATMIKRWAIVYGLALIALGAAYGWRSR